MPEERKHEQYEDHVNKVYKGVHTDNSPLEQPKDCHRFALNAVNEATDGQHLALSNEKGAVITTVLPDNFYVLGDRYLEDNRTAVILKQKGTNRDQIGFMNKDGQYEIIVDTLALKLSIRHQIDMIYRVRRGVERVIYWVDGFNKPRSFNFDRPYNYYTNAYKVYLKGGGNPNTYPGEKWDASAFDLIKTFKSMPFFTSAEVIEVGNILPGSYNFAIQMVDDDLNPTEWITTTNTVNIFNDTLDTSYEKIRGSRNAHTFAQDFPPANKSIRLNITNLDTEFPFYRIAIIAANGVIGQPTEVFASEIQSTSNGIYVFSGNTESLTKISLEDVLIENQILYAPNHIEQLENRLIIADTKGQGIDWCEFQKFASKISADLTTRDIILNSVLSEPNLKNAQSTFEFRGYMPGDAYSFGIMYLFSDMTLSPVFHIPGVSADNLASQMVPYELANTVYEDIHNCADNYWGKDSKGNTLVGHKVRHHRFPFRKDANIPLFERNGDTVTVQKFRLTFKVQLISGQSWPQTGGVNPTDLVIPYKIIYKVGATGSDVTLSRSLVKSDLNTDIVLYDAVDALGNVSGTPNTIAISGVTQEVLVQESATLSDYVNGPLGNLFTISGTYTPYDAQSVQNVDESKIFGITFSNIERPNGDVIGFYIVRNERTEDDKLVVDNAILGPMLEKDQYKAFGLLMPKQFYTVPGSNRNSGKTLTYYNKGCWFFNPEYQFGTRKTSFNQVNVQGQYFESGVILPSRTPDYGGNTDYRAVYIQDVQAGTSFNPSVNKGKDSDGFDMMIGYRNTNVNYTPHNYALPIIERTFYLNAATYQNYSGDTLYNVSSDNKTGVLRFGSNIDTNEFYNPTDKKNNLLYAALTKDNNSAYSNFMTRTYYKEHNNPFMFSGASVVNNISVFNGDAYINPITLNSTTYFNTVVAERKKKNKVWQIVVGAVLVVAGVVAAIFTAGASLTATAVGVGILTAAAISYGISLAVAGFKFEQFKNMVDQDYEKGLKDCVIDGAVFECIGEDVGRADDTIRWFGDRINSLYIESSVPFTLRDGVTQGVVDFIDSPVQFQEGEYRDYLTEKLTTIDRDQGSGRLYKGYATAEFYAMNPDYGRFNKEKVYIHLPVQYDCCADSKESFDTRVWWSEQSFQEELVDNFRVFLPNNYKDVEGENGKITDLFRMGNALFVHSREALWQLPQTYQERVTSEVVSFIGTGSFFEIPPRKLVTDNLGSGGTQHKWATIKTIYGVIFVNEVENKVYKISDKLTEISNEGVRSWFKENLKSYLVHQFYTNLGVNYPNDNNPANPAGVGYLAAFDTRHNRYILTKKDYLWLGSFDNISVGYDPTRDYNPGEIIVDDDGFEQVVSQGFKQPVPIYMGDFVEDPTATIVPTLGIPTSPDNPLQLTYGQVYAVNGILVYKAKSFEDINFNGADHVQDVINVYLDSCTTEQILIVIPNIPSKRCPNFFGSGGTVPYQETKIVLGVKPGRTKFLLSTYSIPDGFKVYYGEPAQNILLWSTCTLPSAGAPPDCLVSTAGLVGNPAYQPCVGDPPDQGQGGAYQIAIIFDYPATDPNIQHVTLVTQAPQAGTAWSYYMGCPCENGKPADPSAADPNWDYCTDCSTNP